MTNEQNGADSGPKTNWVESTPCKCGAQNWLAKRVERIMVDISDCGNVEVQLVPPPSGGAPVRRRSINLMRPMAGILAVNLKEEEVQEERSHDGPHEAIQVIFACDKCKKEFHCTYEVVRERGKIQSFGHYAERSVCSGEAKPTDVGHCCQEGHRYELIQRIYASMWSQDKFSLHYNNCHHWSDGFWWKLHPEEYKKQKELENKLGSRALETKKMQATLSESKTQK